MNLSEQINILIQKEREEEKGNFDFTSIANKLINEMAIKINEEEYSVEEIEFYLDKKATDQENKETKESLYDVFAHEHSGYQTGHLRSHGAGIDIAIREGGFFGGILLRAIEKPDGERVDGPIKVADTIIGKINIFQSNGIQLIERTRERKENIYTFPRVGLKLKKGDYLAKSKEYIFKNWRFITNPRKTKNGKHLMALKLIKENKSYEDVKELVKIEESTFKNYKSHYESNFDDQQVIEQAQNSLNVETTCKLYKALSNK